MTNKQKATLLEGALREALNAIRDELNRQGARSCDDNPLVRMEARIRYTLDLAKGVRP